MASSSSDSADCERAIGRSPRRDPWSEHARGSHRWLLTVRLSQCQGPRPNPTTRGDTRHRVRTPGPRPGTRGGFGVHRVRIPTGGDPQLCDRASRHAPCDRRAAIRVTRCSPEPMATNPSVAAITWYAGRGRARSLGASATRGAAGGRTGPQRPGQAGRGAAGARMERRRPGAGGPRGRRRSFAAGGPRLAGGMSWPASATRPSGVGPAESA